MNCQFINIIAYCNYDFATNFKPKIPASLALVNNIGEYYNNEEFDLDLGTRDEISINSTIDDFKNICEIKIQSSENHKKSLIDQLLPLHSHMKILCEEWDSNDVSLSYFNPDHPSGFILYKTDLIYAWNNPFDTDMTQYQSLFRMITPSRETQMALEKLEIGKRYLKQIEIEIPISFKFIL